MKLNPLLKKKTSEKGAPKEACIGVKAKRNHKSSRIAIAWQEVFVDKNVGFQHDFPPKRNPRQIGLS